jgi:hypothetical protein
MEIVMTLTGSEIKRCKYPLWASLSSALPPLVFLFVGVFLLLSWVGTVFTALTEAGCSSIGENLQLLIGAWIFLILGGTLLIHHTEIIVTDKGIRARILLLKWVFIPWEDVLDVTVPSVLGYSNSSLMRFIQVKKLTPLHQLASLCYTTGSNPVLIINWCMNGYEEVIQIIEEHIKENQNGE